MVAAAIAAMYPNIWIHNSVIMSETVVILLVALVLYVAIGLHHNPTITRPILVGVLSGLGRR